MTKGELGVAALLHCLYSAALWCLLEPQRGLGWAVSALGSPAHPLHSHHSHASFTLHSPAPVPPRPNASPPAEQKCGRRQQLAAVSPSAGQLPFAQPGRVLFPGGQETAVFRDLWLFLEGECLIAMSFFQPAFLQRNVRHRRLCSATSGCFYGWGDRVCMCVGGGWGNGSIIGELLSLRSMLGRLTCMQQQAWAAAADGWAARSLCLLPHFCLPPPLLPQLLPSLMPICRLCPPPLQAPGGLGGP